MFLNKVLQNMTVAVSIEIWLKKRCVLAASDAAIKKYKSSFAVYIYVCFHIH